MTDCPPRADAGGRMRKSIEICNRQIGGRQYGCGWEDPACQTLKIMSSLIACRNQKNARGMAMPETIRLVTRTLPIWARSMLRVTLLRHCPDHLERAYSSGAKRRTRHRIEPCYVQSHNERERNPPATRMPHFMPLDHSAALALHFLRANGYSPELRWSLSRKLRHVRTYECGRDKAAQNALPIAIQPLF